MTCRIHFPPRDSPDPRGLNSTRSDLVTCYGCFTFEDSKEKMRSSSFHIYELSRLGKVCTMYMYDRAVSRLQYPPAPDPSVCFTLNCISSFVMPRFTASAIIASVAVAPILVVPRLITAIKSSSVLTPPAALI